jgi:hypothetical protein
MIFQLFTLAVVGYAVFFHNLGTKPNTAPRAEKFKDPYLPKEADISDHIARNTPFGYVPGVFLGRQEYANPKPLVVLNEFNSKLNETEWGYAAPIGSTPINVEGYRNLINSVFNEEEHPRLDPTRQDFCKGRHRRSQYVFIDQTE